MADDKPQEPKAPNVIYAADRFIDKAYEGYKAQMAPDNQARIQAQGALADAEAAAAVLKAYGNVEKDKFKSESQKRKVVSDYLMQVFGHFNKEHVEILERQRKALLKKGLDEREVNEKMFQTIVSHADAMYGIGQREIMQVMRSLNSGKVAEALIGFRAHFIQDGYQRHVNDSAWAALNSTVGSKGKLARMVEADMEKSQYEPEYEGAIFANDSERPTLERILRNEDEGIERFGIRRRKAA